MMDETRQGSAPEVNGPEGARWGLTELLRDQSVRWKRGEQVPAEDYLGRAPELCGDPDAVLDLIYNEYLLRQERGEKPALAEYVERFPHLEKQLKAQFAVEQFLGGENFLDLTQVQASSEPGSPGSGTPDPPALPRKTAINGYEVRGVLGRGGMGVVFRVWHPALKRQAALKMLRTGLLAQDEELARFHKEAQAVARLQHPNIVQIYEVGTHEGQPYLVLEYLGGESLAKKLEGTPQPVAQTARLLETLARAVHYAHQQGVLHRDLKPANILLATDGTPKVADFGLAKHLDVQGTQTHSGDILGTPSYMAPEQAEGKIAAMGPAVDVYALGAILYEFLTGRPPFQGETSLETLHQVLTQEPVPPRRLRPGVPRDLETICLKALQKEPTKRYPSAEAFAEDLRRYTAGEPIQARPVSAAGRLWRWARRNPLVATLATILALIVLGSILGLSILWRRAETARGRSDKHFQLALRAINRFHKEVGDSEELKAHDLEALRQRLLISSKDLFEELVGEPGTEPRVRLEQAHAYWRLAELTSLIESKDKAVALHQKAVDILVPLARAHPDQEDYQHDLARAHLLLGEAYGVTRQLNEAEQSLQEARTVLTRLLEGAGDRADFRHTLASVHNDLGRVCRQTGRKAEGAEHYRQAEKIFENLVIENPKEPTYGRDLANTRGNLGAHYWEAKELAEAEAAWKAGLEVAEKLARDYPHVQQSQADLARLNNHLAALYHERGQADRAEAGWKKALQIQEKLAAKHKRVATYQFELAVTHHNLGRLYQDERRCREAGERFQTADTLMTTLLEERHGDVMHPLFLAAIASSQGNLANDLADPESALRHLERGGKLLRAALAEVPKHPLGLNLLPYLHGNRARALTALGRYPAALEEWETAIRQGQGKDIDVSRAGRALTRALQGQHAEAVHEARELEKKPALPPSVLFHLARVHAAAARAVSGDESQPPNVRTEIAEHYAGHALDLLEKLAAEKFFHKAARREELHAEPTLAFLRPLPRFQALAGGPPPKKK